MVQQDSLVQAQCAWQQEHEEKQQWLAGLPLPRHGQEHQNQQLRMDQPMEVGWLGLEDEGELLL